MLNLTMKADLWFEMHEGESKEEAEDRLIDLVETLNDQGLFLVGWQGETEVVEDDA